MNRVKDIAVNLGPSFDLDGKADNIEKTYFGNTGKV